jgi:hypothetical protein
MASAVAAVEERLVRATGALNAAGVPYAVVGGNAVGVWVATVDKAAVRNTQDVDILIRRGDLAAVTAALQTVGFTYRHVNKLDIFLDGPNAKIRDSVHVVFAGEKVREHEAFSNPDVTESVEATLYKIVSLEALVRIKLTAYRDKDRTHLRDLLEVGLIDATWVAMLPAELGQRLQALIDTPEG